MQSRMGRRALLQLAGAGGIVFASGLPGRRSRAAESAGDFYFVQLSDTHWGFKGAANPEAALELPRAIELVNALDPQPDFIVFTGDLTHTTDDDAERRKRMTTFLEHAKRLRCKDVKLLPGEHDASLDKGKAFADLCGPLTQTFEHKGIKFIALDNVSDPKGMLGEQQIDWFAKEVKGTPREEPLVVLAHRPLFDLKADWDWTTADGSKAIDVLQSRPSATVFYGHIHQEHHHQTGAVAHHAARSLVFPLPAPGSQPKRAPVPWDPMHPGRGLGLREIEAKDAGASLSLREIALAKEG